MDATNFRPAEKPDLVTRLLLHIAGVDAETLQLCPPQDWDNARMVALIMLCSWAYQTALFTLVGHRLFAPPGQIRPEVVLGSMFIATFILLIDSYMVMRSGWHLSGIQELKRGGLDVSGGPLARIKASLFRAIRVGLSIGLAQLTAIFVSLLLFSADINSPIQNSYLQANTRLIGSATTLVDSEIQRETDAVAAKSAQVAALSDQGRALRQNEIASDPAIQQAQQEVTALIARKANADDAVASAEAFAADEFGGIKGAPGNSGQ